MKKITTILGLSLILVACGTSVESEESKKKQEFLLTTNECM